MSGQKEYMEPGTIWIISMAGINQMDFTVLILMSQTNARLSRSNIMHEKIQDVMNTAWKNYKDYRRSGDMRQYTKQMSALVEKYKGDSLLLQFAENMAITYAPIINAMAEEKRNEQQIGQKEKK